MDRYPSNSSFKIGHITAQLRESIIKGSARIGDQLPSEPELMAQYRVSRSTLREAVASLVHEGLLRRVHGKGTYVSKRPPVYHTIAVSMPYLFFGPSSPVSAGTEVIPRLTQAIEEEARRSDISMMLYLNNNSAEIERVNLERILTRSVDGAIVNCIGCESNIDCLRKIQTAGIPLVMIDLYIGDIEADVITTNNDAGAYQATHQLLNAGCETVYFVTSPAINSALVERQVGYRRAMEERGRTMSIVSPEPSSTLCLSEEQRAYALAKETLRHWQQRPFGVLTADAPLLAGIWQAICESDLPCDRFVLSCFDEPFLLVPNGVRLIKILQPLQEIGRLSVERIKEEINKASFATVKPRITKLQPIIQLVGFSEPPGPAPHRANRTR
jgi:DNA-binding LacI/PurR family transcriptional regulator